MSETTIVEEVVVAGATPKRYLSFGAIVGGAIAAAAVGTVLNGFGVAIGLALSSTSPTWRDTSMALVFLTGLFLLFTSIVSNRCGATWLARHQRIVRDGGELEHW
jgi:hypothetical protein